jgi:hypothetical protein
MITFTYLTKHLAAQELSNANYPFHLIYLYNKQHVMECEKLLICTLAALCGSVRITNRRPSETSSWFLSLQTALFRAFWASFSDSPDIRFWSVLKLLSYF